MNLGDPDSDVVRDALTRKCEVCKAKPNEECVNTITKGAALPGRLVHYARLLAVLALLLMAADTRPQRPVAPDDSWLWSPDGPPVFGHFRSAPLRTDRWLVFERET